MPLCPSSASSPLSSSSSSSSSFCSSSWSCFLCTSPHPEASSPPAPQQAKDKKEALKVPPVCNKHLLFKFMETGLNLRDNLEAFSFADIRDAAHQKKEIDFEEVIPEWVDRDAVVEGQKFFNKNIALCFLALNKALTIGFCISRFSEILVMSGYASSPKATLIRFNSTAQAIVEWISSDLFDPSSNSRKSLRQVRCLHELARRCVRKRWMKYDQGDYEEDSEEIDQGEEKGKEKGKEERGKREKTEEGQGWENETNEVLRESLGEPLSQFDMTMVQLAFSGILLDIFEKDFFFPISGQQKSDLIHLWRLIGHFLGINDENNGCTTVQENDQLTQEMVHLTNYFLSHHTASSILLAQSYVDGFGLLIGPSLAQTICFDSTRTWYDPGWANGAEVKKGPRCFMRGTQWLLVGGREIAEEEEKEEEQEVIYTQEKRTPKQRFRFLSKFLHFFGFFWRTLLVIVRKVVNWAFLRAVTHFFRTKTPRSPLMISTIEMGMCGVDSLACLV